MQKIQTKLLILSLTAMLGMAVYAGMVIQAAWQDYAGMADFKSTSLISQTAYELACNLTDERQSAYNAATFLGEGTPSELLDKYRARIAASQASLGHLRDLAAGNTGRFSERFRASLRQALEAETILNDMRQELLAPGRPQVQDIDARLKSKALAVYDQALSAQASFLPVLSVETEDAELVRKIFTQDNVARLQQDVWKIRGLVTTALRSGRLTETAQSEIKLKLLGIDEHVSRLRNLADPIMAVEVKKLTDGSDYTAVMGKAARLRDLGPKTTDFSELGNLASYQTGPSARLEQSFIGFSHTTMQGIQAYMADRLAKARAHLLFLVGCSLGSMISLSLLVIYFSRSIAHPLKELSEHLAGTAEQARQSVNVIAGSSVRLSEDASEQAAALEEISAAMEELSGMTSSSLDQMPRLGALAESAIKATDQGARHVTHLNDAMQGIRKSTGAVASILKTIDEIAFQTNILALNAAVEAARAGEAGAGFSVVAEEVRALAQRSAQAARETAGKIEAAVKNTEQGAELGRLAQTQFAEISRLSGQFHGIIREVESATKQSTEGVAQVNEAVSRVDQITQRTAGSAEENATTSIDMQARMAAIFELVRRLELMVHSHTSQKEDSFKAPPKPAAKGPGLRPTRGKARQRAFAEMQANPSPQLCRGSKAT